MVHISLSKGQIIKETESCEERQKNKQKGIIFWPYLQVVYVEGLFINVGCVSTHSYTGAGCQIATESTHCLHHKHSPLGPSGRLLDLVATLKGKLKWQCERRHW